MSEGLRQEGNSHFKKGQYLEAIKSYNCAINEARTSGEKASAMKNLATAHLHHNKSYDSVYHATEAFQNAVICLDFGFASKKPAEWISQVTKTLIESSMQNLFTSVINMHNSANQRTKILSKIKKELLVGKEHRKGLSSQFHFQIARFMFNEAIQLQEKNENISALNMIQNGYQEIEFARSASKISEKYISFPPGIPTSVIEEFTESLRYEECYANSCQMIESGNKQWVELKEMEKFSVDMTWNCIDTYRHAITIADDENIIKLELRATAKIGEIYLFAKNGRIRCEVL